MAGGRGFGAHGRRLIEIERDSFRSDVAPWPARDVATSKAHRLLKRDLVETDAESIRDIALKLSVLCNHLRTLLDAGSPGGAWAYRLAEAIHDDAEGLAVQHEAEAAGRDPLALIG